MSVSPTAVPLSDRLVVARWVAILVLAVLFIGFGVDAALYIAVGIVAIPLVVRVVKSVREGLQHR